MPVAGVAASMTVVVAVAACAFVAAARTCLDSRGSPRWMAPIGRRPAVAAAVMVAVAAAGVPSCQRNRWLAGLRERGGH